MASTNANKPASATSAPRRKSIKSKIVTLSLSPEVLGRFTSVPVKEEPSSKDSSSPNSSVQAAILVSSNEDTKPESTTGTPAVNSTPVPSSMPPPTEVIKKKPKRSTAPPQYGPDGQRIRNKPGPKKKARLEDGTIDHSNTAPRAAPGTAHKLGPKANQGAINAGLRALDRSGKPCRKWSRGGFKVKSFTGYNWELPRWTAPPKITIVDKPEDSTTSGDSSKENKDSSQVESEKSNSGVDVEMSGVADQSEMTTPKPAVAPSSEVAPPVVASPV